jgi:surface antigen
VTLKPRTMIAAAAALTVTGSIAAALTLAGSTTSAATPFVSKAGIAAEVQVAPAVVRPAATVIRAHALTATVKRVHVTVTAPKPAAKPAAQPVATTPAAATKPAATAPKPAAAAPAPAPAPTTTVRDDYPYRTATTNDNDEWGFTKRQCVSFAAFRLAQHGNAISNSDNWGSALSWDDAAKRLGKTVTSTPKVGAIAQWNAGESSSVYSASGAKQGTFSAGGYGHVGYVAAVYSDGSVLVEQYNLGGDRSYSSMRMTAPRYILV